MTESELHARIAELEARILRRDATIRQLEAIIRDLRYRVGEGFREEVRHFSESIRGLLDQ